ncbi:TIGR03086 family metal-binding protein [Actinophytocola glycyrrhizae]|uniref:TIGR03086 family metal-binding protein n=1 Tax=Actinophytocola glycyrrhizae TaxID=2044873 RepID=A0ABV9S4H5_9PSEU
MELYTQAQDEFDKMLAAVPPAGWTTPSMCRDWTVRDVAGHAIWGQRQLHSWATGAPDPAPDGAPGMPTPAVMAGEDPLTTWRAARTVPSGEELKRTVTITGMGEIPVAALLSLLVTDLSAHTWDIGHALGLPVRLPPELVTASFDWARDHVVRRPGFFDQEVPVAQDADAQTRMLAFLGRTT